MVKHTRQELLAALTVALLSLSSTLALTNASWAQQPADPKIAPLIEKLKDEDKWKREDAVEALVKAGERAVPALIEALKDRKARDEAAEALGKIGSENPQTVVPALRKVLGSQQEDWRVRSAAAGAIGQMQSKAKDAVPSLIEVLENRQEKQQLRLSAVSALGEIGPAAKDAVRALIRTLADEELGYRWWTAQSLKEIRPEAKTAVPVILELLVANQQDKIVLDLYWLGEVMKSIGKPAVPDLSEALNSQDEQRRQAAAKALGLIGSDAKSAVSKLREVLSEAKQPPRVRAAAAGALGGIGSEAKDAVTDLIQVLKDRSQDKQVRMAAAGALGSIGSEAKDAVTDLIQVLEDRSQDKGVRVAAAGALGSIGSEAKDATQTLIEVLDSQKDDRRVRVAAAGALGSIWSKTKSQAKNAVMILTKVIQNDLEDKRMLQTAAGALGEIGPQAKDSVSALNELLKNKNDKEVLLSAAAALGEIGSDAKEAAPIMKELLKESNEDIRFRAAAALARMGKGEAAIKVLVEAIDQADQKSGRMAEDAFSKMGLEATAAFPDLIERLKSNNYWIASSSYSALGNIFNSLQDKAKYLKLKDLDKAIYELETARSKIHNSKYSYYKESLIELLNRSLEAIKDKKETRIFEQSVNWIDRNKWAVWPAIYIVFFPSLWSLLLWLRPLWLLRLNDILECSDITLPPMLGGFKVSVRTALFVEYFHYHPRVLDAWVAAHLPSVREEFQEKDTVRDRKVHIPMPVILDGKTQPQLTGKDLHSAFKKQRGCVLICGEGGAGKTSLACKIAQWAMSDDEAERLCSHRILPVLIEEELDLEASAGKQPFIAAIRGQLQDLTDATEPISEKLLERLLRQRRVLVIVDHFSEMSDATRKAIRPDSPDFCVNALAITSRIEETLGKVTKNTLKPLRIAGNRLSSFMEAFLTGRGKRDLFTDPEFFDACSRLSLMVGQRNITVLLAKLYAEQLISVKEGTSAGDLPDNIPDLMLSYLNELNRSVTGDKLDDPTVQEEAKALAWECLKGTYRPAPAKREDALACLEGESADKRLNYLENRLRLIQTIGASRDHIRFSLDPLAEYLAGLHLLDIYGKNQSKWRNFLAQADAMTGAPESIKGFLLAVRDCCLAKGKEAKVPDFLIEELDKRTGLATPAAAPATVPSLSPPIKAV